MSAGGFPLGFTSRAALGRERARRSARPQRRLRSHTRKRDVGDGRIGEARQHTDADYRQRVADETTNKIARYHGGALIRGCDLVHHLQTARYPRPVDTATTTVAGMASWGRFIARGPGMKLTCRDDAGEASTRTWMAPESTIICSESAQRVRQSKRRKRTPIEHAAQPRRRIADRAIEARCGLGLR